MFFLVSLVKAKFKSEIDVRIEKQMCSIERGDFPVFTASY